jgi:hypothetical protein
MKETDRATERAAALRQYKALRNAIKSEKDYTTIRNYEKQLRYIKERYAL